MSKKIAVPENECEGCASRDRLIEILAKRVDILVEQRDAVTLKLEEKVLDEILLVEGIEWTDENDNTTNHCHQAMNPSA